MQVQLNLGELSIFCYIKIPQEHICQSHPNLTQKNMGTLPAPSAPTSSQFLLEDSAASPNSLLLPHSSIFFPLNLGS